MRRHRAMGDRFSWIAVLAIVMLAGISLLTQSNSDYYSGDDFYDKQVIWLLMGGIVFVVATLVDLSLLLRGAYVFWGVVVLALLAVALFGTSVNNSQRWLRFGGLSLQPSEMAKLAVVMALARWFHDRRDRVPGGPLPHEGPYLLRQLWVPALLVAVPFLLVLKQPDLGTSLLIAFVAVSIVLWEGVAKKSFAILAVGGLLLVPVAWKYGGIHEYQKDRVRLWLNPDWFKFDADTGVVATARNLQSEQAVWAIGSGEFWGQGSRMGAQSRLKHLPEMHTDMIVATFAEEHGFIGCTALLVLFWIVVLWGLRTAHDARDRFCTLLAVGVSAIVGWQVFINIGMVAGLLPIVGLPLPLLSYGGNAAIMILAGLGLVLNVAFTRGRL